MAVSDRIIVMNAGRIEQQGGPRELYERPATSAWAPVWPPIGRSTGDRRRRLSGKTTMSENRQT
jgi:iron(III) transport system ATP-binding protein